MKRGFTLAEVFLPHPKNQRKNAFTLAEVLITLGIIGVVAALTMPSLIANHRKRVFTVRAKKAYSQIAQAIKLYQAQEESPGDITGLFDPTKNSLEVTEAFSKYFNVAQLCTAASSTCGNGGKGIQYKFGKKSYNAEDKTNGPVIAIRPNAYGYFHLNDGTMIAVRVGGTGKPDKDAGKCQITEDGYQLNDDGTVKRDENNQPIKCEYTSRECARIYFDTNGEHQGPNQLGVDTFRLGVGADGNFIRNANAENDVSSGDRNLYRILKGLDIEDVENYTVGETLK